MGGGGRRDLEDSSSRPAQAKSSQDLISDQRLGTVVGACHPSYMGTTNKKKIMVQACLDIK
jgi:hypothetical protein